MNPVTYVEEMTSRNKVVIRDDEQAALHATKLLIAGSGSVGGALVDPVVRLGVGALVLADPDSFELHNANRQICGVADIGRPKVDVHAEHARSINPFIEVSTYPEGITPENIEAAFDEVTQVFDGIGIDDAKSLWAKYLVHRHAALRRLPVISGADLGGKAVLYIFDYRRDPRTFHGKARVRAFREGNEMEALSMSGPRPLPSDFFPVIEMRMDTGMPWPQVAYTTHLLGALSARTMIDLAMSRRVRARVSTDAHLQTRGTAFRALQRARWPVGAYRLRKRQAGLAELMAEQAGSPDADVERALDGLGLLAVARAVRTAPSRYNSQPWMLTAAGPGTASLDVNPDRVLRYRDRDGDDLRLALGCAAEAAARATGAEVHVERSEDGFPTVHLAVATNGVDRDGALRLLRARRTSRGPFSTGARRDPAIDRLSDGQLLCGLRTDGDRHEIAAALGRCRTAELTSEPYAEELFDWLRFGPGDKDFDDDGLPADGLGLSGAREQLGRALKRRLPARRVAVASGWARGLASESVRTIAGGGTLLLVATPAGHDAVEAGRALMRAWLDATEAGLAVHPHSLAGLAAGARTAVGAQFEAGPELRPLLVLQVGHAPGAATSPAARLRLHRFTRLPAQP